MEGVENAVGVIVCLVVALDAAVDDAAIAFNRAFSSSHSLLGVTGSVKIKSSLLTSSVEGVVDENDATDDAVTATATVAAATADVVVESHSPMLCDLRA